MRSKESLFLKADARLENETVTLFASRFKVAQPSLTLAPLRLCARNSCSNWV